MLPHLLTVDEPSPTAVREILEEFCFAIVVSQSEDRLLNQNGLRKAMPSGWAFAPSNCDPMARYVASKLGGAIQMPLSRELATIELVLAQKL